MKIELKCITGGYKFGDIVVVGKDTIDSKVAEDLVKNGLANEIAEPKEAKKSKSKEK